MEGLFWRVSAIVSLAVILAFGLLYISGDLIHNTYKGKIVKMYKQPGYRGDIDNHVVFYSDSLNRNIDVIVTDNEYVNLVVGQTISKKLTESELK